MSTVTHTAAVQRAATDTAQPRPRRRKGNALRYTVVGVLGLIWLLPLYLVLVNAFRPSTSYTGQGLWKPSAHFALLGNFAKAWDAAALGQSLTATVLYSVVAPAIAALVGALAGYAITILQLRRGFLWFMLIYGSVVFPAQMLLMPLFVGYADLNLFDSRIGLVLVYVAVDVPLATFVMRNFFMSAARSVFESGLMDGANPWTIFWRIYLPMCRAGVAAIFVLEFTFVWNDLLFGMVLSQSDGIRPLMTSLSTLSNPYAGITVPVILAGGLILSLPTIALFIATQKLFAKGLTLAQL
ncbi:carbohydrate ABC transporter permease [Streptomyces sp. NPDC049040]|uniref:carbohydrate ABC transporter permease n=1 Tax=Streptomyces sp. NPDC049040 TaxID=3365593 RepID=UPI003716B854